MPSEQTSRGKTKSVTKTPLSCSYVTFCISRCGSVQNKSPSMRHVGLVFLSFSNSVDVDPFVNSFSVNSYSFSIAIRFFFLLLCFVPSVSHSIFLAIPFIPFTSSFLIFASFLGATKHVYKKACPSVRPSVRPFVRPSVGP